MIQLKKFESPSFIWVNPDHITFLSLYFEKRKLDGPTSTVITTIGGGQVKVEESPEKIMKEMR
jgi:hypothetical protein